MYWESLVETIRADDTSGASELARMAATAVLEWADQTASVPAPAWKEELQEFAPRLCMAQPAMAPLFNLANAILLAAEATAFQEEPQARVRRAVHAFLERLSRMSAAMTTAALGLLPPGARVLTFSYSSSVLAVLREAHAQRRVSAVLCTESRPILEGQRLTRELARAGIAVELGVDAAMATFTRRADMALVGADSLTVHGVINKVGTTCLALACRHTGTPCYVVADRHKWRPAGALAPASSQPKPAAEIWSDPPTGVTIWNAYFECTPMTLFSGIVGEDGLRRPEELLRQLMVMPIAQPLQRRPPGVD
jgi:translation initiation factor 2B subunit (eIF-2B alpha/beta/delta family)